MITLITSALFSRCTSADFTTIRDDYIDNIRLVLFLCASQLSIVSKVSALIHLLNKSQYI
jgi:hypothetical protein